MMSFVFLGLKVIGSTCDQVQTNVSAINGLIDPKNFSEPKKQDGQILKYTIRDSEIIHCYDLPHLLKVVRNNFLNKDLEHCISKRWNISDSDGSDNVEDDNVEEIYTADWKVVADVYYDLDLKGSQRLLKKITDEHIKPDKL